MLIDANLLIYATDTFSPHHKQSFDWLDIQFNESRQVSLPWPVLLAFQRIITNPRLMQAPLASDQAWEQIERWLALPNVWIPEPTPRHAEVLGGLIRATKATGNLVTDAHLAAIAIEHGVILYSLDGDFARFPGLRWENPLRRSR